MAYAKGHSQICASHKVRQLVIQVEVSGIQELKSGKMTPKNGEKVLHEEFTEIFGKSGH